MLKNEILPRPPLIAADSESAALITAAESEAPPRHASVTEPKPVWGLTVAYDGSSFYGWQIQGRRTLTVQGEIQARLRRLLRDDTLRLAASSRTDAGVHALGQRASFIGQLPEGKDADWLRETLNRWLPPEIQIVRAEACQDDFHARYSACAKAYTYVLVHGRFCSPFWTRYAWHLRPRLALAEMRAAAELLQGTHDFASFAVNPRRELESTERTLHRVQVLEQEPFVFINVVGTSFLYKMVRTIAGQLAAVGLGKVTVAQTAAVLAAADRSRAEQTAPPNGLFLDQVFYDPEAWRSYQPQLPPFNAFSGDSNRNI